MKRMFTLRGTIPKWLSLLISLSFVLLVVAIWMFLTSPDSPADAFETWLVDLAEEGVGSVTVVSSSQALEQ